MLHDVKSSVLFPPAGDLPPSEPIDTVDRMLSSIPSPPPFPIPLPIDDTLERLKSRSALDVEVSSPDERFSGV